VESFEAEIVEARGGGAFVEVPADVVAALGGKGRIKVSATFDGIPYRGSIVSMGGGSMVLGILKDIRGRLEKSPGDHVDVTVEVDDAERTVDVPDDLAAALDDTGSREAFDALSYSHRREYVTWIEEAKKPETRARRINQTVERLRG
jgi:Bacteriocin-protection, YdeI or OmpD-Associated/Domain of unknown function (DUF1905)